MYKSPHDPAGPPEQSKAVCPLCFRPMFFSPSARPSGAKPRGISRQNAGGIGTCGRYFGENVIYQARLRGWQVLVELPFSQAKKDAGSPSWCPSVLAQWWILLHLPHQIKFPSVKSCLTFSLRLSVSFDIPRLCRLHILEQACARMSGRMHGIPAWRQGKRRAG